MSIAIVRSLVFAAVLLPVVAGAASAGGKPARGKAAAEPTPRAQWQVFQCRDAAGVRIFQDVPCPRDAAHVRTLRLVDEASTDDARIKAARKLEAKLITQWERASQSRLPKSLGGSASAAAVALTMPAAPRAPDACEIARGDRDRAYRERANSLRFDDRRALLDRIAIACAR